MVSVCIPVFNGEVYIENAIKSVISQSYKNIEIIVSDNCSTDDTLKIAKKFQDKVVICSRDKNYGAYDNFLFSIKCANGKYIMTMGVDDFLYPDSIEKLVNIIEKESSIVAIGTVLKVMPETKYEVVVQKVYSIKNLIQITC